MRDKITQPLFYGIIMHFHTSKVFLHSNQSDGGYFYLVWKGEASNKIAGINVWAVSYIYGSRMVMLKVKASNF